MLRGYRMDNSKSDSSKPAYSYTPDPKTRYNNPIFASEQRYIDSVRSSRRDSSPASDQTSQFASESRLTATNRA